MSHTLRNLGASRASGKPIGISSVCSAHPWVIEAAMDCASRTGTELLLEATCNQVNQEGGYTGMTPADFRQRVEEIARQRDFPLEKLILGGDHLGPNPWKHLPATEAMRAAAEMVKAYVGAGFHKIHIDASMSCAGDPSPLPGEIIAERAALLCKVAEDVSEKSLYIIGTEVPTPGGSTESLEHLSVTTQQAARETLEIHRKAFERHGISHVWQRVIGLVVQPGVEFSHDSIAEYNPERTTELTKLLAQQKNLVFEAHSTDYQLPTAYRSLVEDGFAILKVGPALTFAMREALFQLTAIETELIPENRQARLPEVLEKAMLANPEYWKDHYQGSETELRQMRRYSYSDRIRYYWNDPTVAQAVGMLVRNLQGTVIPETLLSTWMPAQYHAMRRGELKDEPVAMVRYAITEVLRPYLAACG